MNTLSIDEALESLPFSFFHWRLIIMCGFAFMADALEVSLLSFLSTCAGADWDLTHGQKATITSVVFGGTIVGSLLWGQVADKFGRRLTYLLGCILISSAGILSGLSPSYEWLLLFRCLVGFGVGGSTIPFDLIAEFLPPSYRGKYLNYIQWFWTIGALIVNGLAWLVLSSLGWRVLTFLVALPVVLTSFFSYIYLPESPRWLLTQGRVAEAEEVVRNAAALCGVNLGPFRLVIGENEVEFDHSVNIQVNKTNILDLVRHKKMRRISIKLFIVWFAFGFAYYGIILFVSRVNTDQSRDEGCNFNYKNMFINSTSEFIGVILTILLIDIFGRVRTQGTLYLCGGFASLGLYFSKSPLTLVLFAWVARMFMMGSSSATWVITPELYPTELRATGHAVCNTSCRVGAFLSPYFVISRIPITTVALGLGLFNVLAAIASYSLPETVGIALDTIIPTTSVHDDTSIATSEFSENDSISMSNSFHGLLAKFNYTSVQMTERTQDTPPNSMPSTPLRHGNLPKIKEKLTFHPLHVSHN